VGQKLLLGVGRVRDRVDPLATVRQSREIVEAEVGYPEFGERADQRNAVEHERGRAQMLH
jgi:hypothetical protein